LPSSQMNSSLYFVMVVGGWFSLESALLPGGFHRNPLPGSEFRPNCRRQGHIPRKPSCPVKVRLWTIGRPFCNYYFRWALLQNLIQSTLEIVLRRSVSTAHPRIPAHPGRALRNFRALRTRPRPRGEGRILQLQVLLTAGWAGARNHGFGFAAADKPLELVAAGFTKIFVDRHALIIHRSIRILRPPAVS
jgi:hypothetical protein